MSSTTTSSMTQKIINWVDNSKPNTYIQKHRTGFSGLAAVLAISGAVAAVFGFTQGNFSAFSVSVPKEAIEALKWGGVGLGSVGIVLGGYLLTTKGSLKALEAEINALQNEKNEIDTLLEKNNDSDDDVEKDSNTGGTNIPTSSSNQPKKLSQEQIKQLEERSELLQERLDAIESLIKNKNEQEE